MAESKAYKKLKRQYQPASQTMPANWSYKKKAALPKPKSPFQRLHKMKSDYSQCGGYARQRSAFGG